MIQGETITCPHCGEKSVVKSKAKMEGWTKVGTVLVCALCGAELGTPDEKSAEDAGRKKLGSLAALLGEGAGAAPKADLTPDENYGRFCRNCVHFIEHPFRVLCGLDGHEIDPMGECGKFERK